MEQINIYEAKTQLSRLVDRAFAGEQVIIARHGKPLAVLSAYRPEANPPAKRVGGQWHGKVRMSDDFNAPDEALEKLFYDGAIFPTDSDA